jgi:hypothetical protein
LSGGTLSGLVGSEELELSGLSGSFANANAGTGKSVAVTGASLADGTGLASNYTVSNPSGVTGNITPKALTVTGVAAADKTYDGSAAATLSGGTLSGLVGSETLTLSGLAGSFANANAGTGKSVAVTGASLADGTGLASNYTVSNPSGVTASITPKALSVKVDDASKVAAQANPAFSVTYDGFVVGEGSEQLDGALVFATEATQSSPAGVYAVSASGQSAQNYALHYADGSLNVTAAPVNVPTQTAVAAALTPSIVVARDGGLREREQPAPTGTGAPPAGAPTMPGAPGSAHLSGLNLSVVDLGIRTADIGVQD